MRRRSELGSAAALLAAAWLAACAAPSPDAGSRTSGATSERAPCAAPLPAAAESTADAAPASMQEPALSQPAALPSAVDLRRDFERFGFAPRAQGARNTCSIFTTTAALEFALARLGEPVRLSPEFVNWAASQAGGAPSDGNFFHNALAGFERFGASSAELCPYRETFDAAFEPSAEARADASARLERTRAKLSVHWTVPWVPDRFGLDEARFAEFKRVLAAGAPIAAGSSHSRLLVGYRDDAALDGGGAFLVLDSALARFDEITYAFAREHVADAFWVEPLPR